MAYSYWAIQSIATLALVAAYWQGWIDDYILYDRTGISQAIALLGIAGSVYMIGAWRSQYDYNRYLATVNTIASYAVQLGLLGTLIGIMIALGGIVTVSGATELKGMVALIVEGMKIALGTSIIGCIVALFLGVHRLTFKLVTGIDDDAE